MPRTEQPSDLEPLIFQVTIDKKTGCTLRPASAEFIEIAIRSGRPIVVYSQNDYINLYHVLERRNNRHKTNYQLPRQQVAESEWILHVCEEGKTPPKAAPFARGYNPKRGRYKRYSDMLKGGETLMFQEREEAVKARRAWQLYVPAAKRQSLTGKITRVPHANRWIVRIIERIRK